MRRFGRLSASSAMAVQEETVPRDLNATSHVYCSARGHSLHLFGDMVDTFRVAQIDHCDLMSGKEYSELSIGAERPNGEPLTTECLRDFPEPSLEADVGFRRGDGADDLARVVFHLGRRSGMVRWLGR
jgi:hypothetical protein